MDINFSLLWSPILNLLNKYFFLQYCQSVEVSKQHTLLHWQKSCANKKEGSFRGNRHKPQKETNKKKKKKMDRQIDILLSIAQLQMKPYSGVFSEMCLKILSSHWQHNVACTQIFKTRSIRAFFKQTHTWAQLSNLVRLWTWLLTYGVLPSFTTPSTFTVIVTFLLSDTVIKE